MPRRVFYSFHFTNDNWRVGQVRNIGIVEDNAAISDHDWEEVKKGGDAAIQRWIDDQLSGRGCTVVLVGSQTAGRKWINYEIIKSWNDGKGVLGVYIHRLKDRNQRQDTKGANPFDVITLGNFGARLSSVVKAYDPPVWESTDAYNYIRTNLPAWIEEAIQIRNAQ